MTMSSRASDPACLVSSVQGVISPCSELTVISPSNNPALAFASSLRSYTWVTKAWVSMSVSCAVLPASRPRPPSPGLLRCTTSMTEMPMRLRIMRTTWLTLAHSSARFSSRPRKALRMESMTTMSGCRTFSHSPSRATPSEASRLISPPSSGLMRVGDQTARLRPGEPNISPKSFMRERIVRRGLS